MTHPSAWPGSASIARDVAKRRAARLARAQRLAREAAATFADDRLDDATTMAELEAAGRILYVDDSPLLLPA